MLRLVYSVLSRQTNPNECVLDALIHLQWPNHGHRYMLTYLWGGVFGSTEISSL